MTTLVYLYYFKFNNYYNRQLKLKSTLAEYTSIQGALVGNTTCKVNFNPGDQINTQQVVNDENIINADYLLTVDDSNTIISRWFITEAKRNLKGQWLITLKRDVLADNWSDVKYSPMFIEKATIPASSKFIFNPESISCNQIKQSETLLKDDTGCGWLCGYIAKNSQAWQSAKTFDVSVIQDFTNTTLSDFTATHLNNLQFNTFYKGAGILKQLRINVTIPVGTIPPSYRLIGTPDELEGETIMHWTYESLGSTEGGYAVRGYTNINTLVSDLNSNRPVSWNTISTYHSLYITDYSSYSSYNASLIQSMNNKYVYTSNDDKYYKLSTSNELQDTNYNIGEDKAVGYLLTYLKNALSDYMNITYGTYLYLKYGTTAYRLSNTEVATATYEWTLKSEDNRYRLKDAPYYMFCIPYGDVTITANTKTFTLTKAQAMYYAQGIASTLSSSELLDLQLLPYCPLGGYTVDPLSHAISFGTLDTKRYEYIYPQGSQTPSMIIFWALASSGTKEILYSYLPTNYKMDTITKKYRLCSPNMSGVYEFDAAKNGGLNGFNVDYTYLPYNPYIHLTFTHSDGSLYGYHSGDLANDWNDPTGLICGGQFSIAYNSSKWVDYEVNNKNYQNSFNRSIENMEVNHKYDMINQIAGAGLNAAATGIQTGLIMGPAAGIAAGAISAGAGLIDTGIQEEKYKESKSYATDNFNMQLDNVKSLPNTLAKVTAYTENNKVFPFLEIYDCTDEEKTAIANKIAYNGMSLGIIGTINDYLANNWSYGGITDKGFIKGKMIRFIGADDSHLANEIANRLAEGVYTK